ncbi:MAG: riboflavin synthase subunit alpha [Candidatus Nitrosocaldaceae archaeon]|nr:MAG: riboflavin synthase subunit alpha [Candidatus Nitrosocaldaceae archaeon]
MFTGIIKNLGKVKRIEKSEESGRSMILDIDIGDTSDIKEGDSIAVNGACLTVVKIYDSIVRFELVGETISRTVLGLLREGDIVNIERSLKVGDTLDGHFVLGHIDGIAEIIDKKEEKDQTIMQFRVIDKRLMKYIAEKGSIAVDGISLTVVNVYDDKFSVALIPHTLANTTLGVKGKGDKVNLEVDVLSRYLERLNLPEN